MEPEFWIERWQRNEIGFHQDRVNVYLEQLWSALIPDPHCPVFVPLCGKSKDMAWLRARGHTVVGVELSRLAVESFFTELKQVPTRSKVDGMELFESPGYTIYCGDYFALKSQHLAHVCATYDRASLVALPPSLRERYAQHMAQLLAPGVDTLLIALDYPAAQMQGPPFSVNDAEVQALYSELFAIRSLSVRETLNDNPRFKERGLTRLAECVYALHRTATVVTSQGAVR